MVGADHGDVEPQDLLAAAEVHARAVLHALGTEPAADLAVSLAGVSSLTDRPIPEKVAVFGEIGLAGEVRPAPRGQERLREAAKLGLEKLSIPRANQPSTFICGAAQLSLDLPAGPWSNGA